MLRYSREALILLDTLRIDFQETFSRISLISERFASSSAWQYHSALPSLSELVTYIEQKICPPTSQRCHSEAQSLASASYLDIDYDTISQVVVLSAFWHEPPSSLTWEEQIENSEGADQVEVGVLANEQPTEPEELSLGGFLTVVGEDDKPSTDALPLTLLYRLTNQSPLQTQPSSPSPRAITHSPTHRATPIAPHSFHQPASTPPSA